LSSKRGFTLLELLVSVAILGVLTATAFPTYKQFRARAVGAEANQILKNLMDVEVAYFLENDNFYPPTPGDDRWVYDNAATDQAAIEDALNVRIPTGHSLDVRIQNTLDADGNPVCTITINSVGFPIFVEGGTQYEGVMGSIDDQGKRGFSLINPQP